MLSYNYSFHLSTSPDFSSGEEVPEVSEIIVPDEPSEISSDEFQEEESSEELPEEESFSEEESHPEEESHSETSSQIVVDNQEPFPYSPQLDTLIGVGLFLIVIILSFMIYKELCKLFDC